MRSSSVGVMSNLIQRAFEDALRHGEDLPGRADEPVLAAISIGDAVRFMHDRARPVDQQDELLAAVVRCYRRHPTGGWSAIILEMLAPILIGASKHFGAIPHSVDDEDVTQQIVAEALSLAASMPLHDPPHQLQRRFKLRVLTMTARWLSGMARGASDDNDDSGWTDVGWEHGEEARAALIAYSELGASPYNLGLLYRWLVLRQSVPEIAAELGITPGAVRGRQRRLLKRMLKFAPHVFVRLTDGLRTVA